jgi:2-keto-4-pentenoate hydratase/2-oxohepta-3-ene-1,7-dioic acid hydratase in catechol pathway
MTIYCIGRNYVKHAQELKNEVPTSPLIFLKAESAIRSFAQAPIAFAQETFHYETELVLTFGKDLELGAPVTNGDIEFLSLGLDLTRREVQSELKSKGLPWTLSKSFAGSAILGKKYPFSTFADSSNIVFEFKLNGETRQRGESQHMIFSFLTICNFLNSFSPLCRGDLIFTGTPEGVGTFQRGDHFETILENQYSEKGQL